MFQSLLAKFGVVLAIITVCAIVVIGIAAVLDQYFNKPLKGSKHGKLRI